MASSDWKTTTLGQVIELKRGYDLPSRDRRDGPYPIVSSSGVSGCHAEAKAKAPGVVIGRYGTLGQVHYITQDYWPLNTSLYVRDFKGNDPRFINYFLRSLDFGAYSDKAAVPGLNRNDLHTAVVRVPPVTEQRVIAGVLGALDDKIELNRRMTQTLDSMARALFKSWFVDFDPVRAKAEGRDPHLSAQLAGAFPDSFSESEMGKIPSGWRAEPLGDHIEVVRGLSYKGSGLAQAGMPLHNLNSVREGGGYKDEGIKFYDGEYRSRHVTRPGDLLVANTEQGHHRLLIGYAALVPGRFPTGLVSHHLYRVRPNSGSPLTAEFLCNLLNSDIFHDAVSRYANGTTVNMLPEEALKMPFVVVPPSLLVESFSRLTGEMRRCQEMAVESQRTVLRTRNVLLPALLAGASGAGEPELAEGPV
jgi:type I restriction enzyme S subunit